MHNIAINYFYMVNFSNEKKKIIIINFTLVGYITTGVYYIITSTRATIILYIEMTAQQE